MKPLLATLREYGIVNIRTTEFHQGRNTRWAIGWSFSDEGLIEMVVLWLRDCLDECVSATESSTIGDENENCRQFQNINTSSRGYQEVE